ncbi:heparin lyase I family protein [Bradyrhizobium sp. CCBAU 051011]|uniref:heparin lyase I family protein n=1 Tax=Bradyrhizobium sp. CCBAU 051011 TaxID=858422 RepID=UPI001FEDBDA1|nr:heparin lyase I family protein [Bradyrhizobium sp. CCBAU 051011]
MPTSPPVAVELVGDRLRIVARYTQPGGDPRNGSPDLRMVTLWTDPNPIVPGKFYDINIQTNVSNSGGGYLDVSIDGRQVVDYSGPLGYGAGTYWTEGLYRNAGPTQTVIADYRNLTVVTGSMANGWQGVGGTTPTQPTTPTTPITPPNVAPSVTQVSASPGTGIADNGDTITMTLGFSEAVTVTGTPTLALNNGDTAAYVGGSGTSSLTFRTTVAPTDRDTSAVAITGVNLPSGASIKDLSGLAANLSGAVKTFTGLQIDATPTSPTTPTTPTTPTSPTTPTTPTTPTSPTTPTTPTSSVTRPVLTIADNTLAVRGRGGTVDLGTRVTTTDTNDRVTVNVTGLSRYDTITTSDGQSFRGSNITLTAAQVNSGLELHSYYRRGGHPDATLTLTANAKDPVTGAVTSAAPQTIAVTDARSATTTTTSPQTPTVTTPPVTSTTAPTTQQPVVTTAASAGSLASRGYAMLQGHVEPATSTLATTRSQATVTDPQLASGTTTASLANQSFALLNQYLAGNTGRVDSGQIVSAVSRMAGYGQEAILTRPH